MHLFLLLLSSSSSSVVVVVVVVVVIVVILFNRQVSTCVCNYWQIFLNSFNFVIYQIINKNLFGREKEKKKNFSESDTNE